MFIRLIYLFMVRVFGWLVLLVRSDAAKDMVRNDFLCIKMLVSLATSRRD